jgi:oxygen-independent coproporphyrinogen-3 oxidase
MSKLIERAKRIEKSLNSDQLAKAGFRREFRSVADSHHTVTYPEKNKASPVNPEYIFSKPSGTDELSLYLHIPFCTGKCVYCQYKTFPNPPPEKLESYLSALEKEIDLVSKIPYVKNSPIFSTYIGGGTPTYLSQKHLERLLKRLRKSFDFVKPIKDLGGVEFTVEASPETILEELGREKLDILKKYRVNRLSLGIQTFNDKILSSMKRRYNSKQAKEAIDIAKEKFDNLNIDLIPDLPDQTLDTWESDLETVLDMEIPSVTTYPLKIKPEASIYKLFEKNPQKFSDEETSLLMKIMAMERFGDRFYMEYPVWWFTSFWTHVYDQQIHKWEENGELLALGVSGYSYINNWQYYNSDSLNEYLEAIEKNNLPIWKGINLLTKEEQATRNMILGIRCTINKLEFKMRHGFKPEEKFGDKLKKLENLGLISNSEREIKLTYTGRLFAEEVARYFIPKNKS